MNPLSLLNSRRFLVVVLLLVMAVFFVVQLAAQEATGDRVAVGQPVLGRLTTDMPSQSYVFTLRSAEIVDINVAGLSPLFTPTVRIYDQSGELVHAFENLYSRSDYSTMIDFTQPGTYTVEVASLYPVDTQYTFNLQPVGNHYVSSEPLNRGEMVKGAINTSSGLSRYAFDALPAAFQQLTISGETSADGMVISLVNRTTNQVVAVLDETMPGVSYCIPSGHDQYSVEIVNNGTLVAKDYMLNLSHVSSNSPICSLSGMSQRMSGTGIGSLLNVLTGSLDQYNPMRVFSVNGTPGSETVVEVVVNNPGDGDDDGGGLLVIVEDLLNGDVLSILDLSAVLNGLVILPEGDGQYLLKVLLDAQTSPRDVTLNVLGAEGDLLNVLANLNEEGLYTHGSVFSTSIADLNAYTTNGLHLDGNLFTNDVVDAALNYTGNGLHLDGDLFTNNIVDATLNFQDGIAVTGSVIDYGVVSGSITSDGIHAGVLGSDGLNVNVNTNNASVQLGSSEIITVGTDGISIPIVGDLPVVGDIVGDLPIVGELPIVGGGDSNNNSGGLGGLLGGLFP
jgi:hypothetical protein